jgi:hypothetical protein
LYWVACGVAVTVVALYGVAVVVAHEVEVHRVIVRAMDVVLLSRQRGACRCKDTVTQGMSASSCPFVLAVAVGKWGLMGPRGRGRLCQSARMVERGDWAAKEEVSKKKMK